MPPLMVQEPIPDQEQNPFVGDSQEGIEYVSGYYSKILIFFHKKSQIWSKIPVFDTEKRLRFYELCLYLMF